MKKAIPIVILLLTLLVLPLAPALAQSPQPLGPSDPAELQAFVDGIMAVQLSENHVAGATIVVVKDGEIFFAKGYGYADVEKHLPVDPETTLFRIGSISKLFTWTAVMQLYEQGRLDLGADVNTYLDFEIPATYPDPITLEHLLTHTPGFEDRGYGMGAATPEDLISNGQWLAENIPARVRPAGQFSAYSNYGASLAGYIVERVAGMPYDEYIETYVLEPLGMTQTTSRQPLPAGLAPYMSGGYQYASGAYEAQDFELMIVAPAGSFSATATDMARFMIAHLQDGQYQGQRILQASTAQLMHSRLFAHDERLNGFAYGFYETSQNGQRIIGHGGDTNLFHSLLALLPEHNLGLFVSYNSVDGSMLPQELRDAFMDHYYPVPDAGPLQPPADFEQQASRFVGNYRFNRSSYTTAEKIMGLFTSVKVQAPGDGTLLVNSPLGAQRFVQVDSLLFYEVGGDEQLLFRQDGQGRITHAFLNSMPVMGIEKLSWYEAPFFHYLLMGLSSLLFLSVLVAGTVGFFLDRGRTVEKPPRLARLARWPLALLALSHLLVPLLVVIGLSDMTALMTGNAPVFQILPAIGIAQVLLAVVGCVFAVLAWRKRYWNLPGRLHYTLVSLAALAMIWFAAYWNMLSWNL